MTHDLIKAANEAAFEVFIQERTVLKALSHIGEWGGRYPIASGLDKYVGDYPLNLNPNSLLDWGSAHPIMWLFLNRAMKALDAELPQPISIYDSVIAFRPKIN
jgi:hypothetical protein